MDETTDAKPGTGAKDAMAAFAAKADDLDEIKKSVNEAAATSGALWISYLSVLIYTGSAVGAVTSVDLFMENPVRLPFLSTDLPLKAFFFLVPVLILIVHVYTLMSFVILSDKAKWYHRESRRQIDAAGADDPGRARQIRDDLRRHLVSNIFVQFLAGPGDLRQGLFGLVLKVIVWTTLVVAPIALLLEVQVQFLPFHDLLITWTHRVVLLLDIVAVWWLWYRILAGRFSEDQTWHRWTAALVQGVVVVASVLALVFSWAIVTFNDKSQETALRRWPAAAAVERSRMSLRNLLFDGEIDSRTRRRAGLLASTLVLARFDIYEQLKIEDPAKVASQRSVFRTRGRDFRSAVFDLSNLSQVDFEGAHLEAASFDLATVRTASFYCAQMQGVVFNNAKIEGAWFHTADLTGAKMKGVSGQGARFEGAVLNQVNLKEANLQAATLDAADLTGADLTSSSLKGASLASLKLDRRCALPEQPEPPPLGVTFANADLTNADLEDAYLQGADLTKVKSLQRAKLGNADLSDATVSEVALSGFDQASILRGIRLDDAKWEDSESMARSVATGREPTVPKDSPHETLLAHAVRVPPIPRGSCEG